MSTGRQAVESDGLWKAPSDLPTGLGKRGPYPVFHSFTQLRRRIVLPMSIDESVTHLLGSTGRWALGSGLWAMSRFQSFGEHGKHVNGHSSGLIAQSPVQKSAAEAALLRFTYSGAYSPGGFLNSWMAALLLRLSASTTFLAWSSPVWQPTHVAWVGTIRPLALAASGSFMMLIFL